MRGARSLLLAAALLASPSALAQPSPREVAERVRAEGGYRDRLPLLGGSSEDDAEAGGAIDGAGRRPIHSDARERDATAPRQQKIPDFRFPLPTWAGKGLTIALLALLAVLLVLAIALGVRSRLAREPLAPRPRGQAAKPGAAEPLAIRWVEGDPDALAAQGRYEEALAALLVRSLLLVGWKPSGAWRSRTAREVLALLAHADPRRRWLLDVVRIEELVAFAGHEATRERFEAARASWLRLEETRAGAAP